MYMAGSEIKEPRSERVKLRISSYHVNVKYGGCMK